MLNNIFKELSWASRIREDGPDPLAFVKIPSLPSVAKTFQENAGEAKFQFNGEIVEREVYFNYVIQKMRTKSIDRLTELFNHYSNSWSDMTKIYPKAE